jgi:hypothetical protein
MGMILVLGLLTFVGAVVVEIWLRLDDRVRKLERSRRPWDGVVESWNPSPEETSELVLKLQTHVPDDLDQFTSGFALPRENRG